MSTIRTGDLAQFTRTMGNMQQVQSRLRYANLQVATGKAFHSYAEMGADTGTLVRTETALRQAETFADQNRRLGQELNLMDGALASIKDVAEDFQRALVARRNAATGDAIRLDLQAEGMIDRVVDQLNLKVDSRHVFAGSRIDAPPVDPSLLDDDPNNTQYYQGDHVPLRARIDVRAQAEYGVLADDQPFKDLFAALHRAVDGHLADDDAKLTQASALAAKALDGVIARRSELATVAARVASTRESQEGTALYLGDAVSELTDTDVPATMARIAQDQVALEASYSVMTRLNRLSLTDYMR
jgi:flagellar hook-associated protein 3 FlgL